MARNTAQGYFTARVRVTSLVQVTLDADNMVDAVIEAQRLAGSDVLDTEYVGDTIADQDISVVSVDHNDARDSQ